MLGPVITEQLLFWIKKENTYYELREPEQSIENALFYDHCSVKINKNASTTIVGLVRDNAFSFYPNTTLVMIIQRQT